MFGMAILTASSDPTLRGGSLAAPSSHFASPRHMPDRSVAGSARMQVRRPRARAHCEGLRLLRSGLRRNADVGALTAPMLRGRGVDVPRCGEEGDCLPGSDAAPIIAPLSPLRR